MGSNRLWLGLACLFALLCGGAIAFLIGSAQTNPSTVRALRQAVLPSITFHHQRAVHPSEASQPSTPEGSAGESATYPPPEGSTAEPELSLSPTQAPSTSEETTPPPHEVKGPEEQ